MKIAIIDIIGLPYDGTTVFKQGLGGSESAVTFMARELAALDFEVTVFNNCNIDHAQPGIYDQVRYRPLSDLAQDLNFDVVVSSRTVIPFTSIADYPKLGDGRAFALQQYNLYDRIVAKASMRVLWMHDTFCLGDNLIEELAVANRITDIFTLTDFHLTYVGNCHHGRRRNFEVLKRRLFLTRNGARCYNTAVDIAAKDRDLFVFNASVTKGMIPLVNDIWPRVKQLIPTARLKVIGGYYRFSSTSEPDAQEQDWRAMVADPKYTDMDIEFTGVIPQQEIAQILTQANFMIYPCAFPETFGISTLESLLYNTPVITCRFGGLEEVAVEGASYLIDYPVEPNSLFPDINKPDQVERFVTMTVQAYNDTYLHQQKQYYCNVIKDIAGWDSVALQWKQHIFKKTSQYLPRDEYQAVTQINRKIHKIWNRRYTNTVEFEHYKAGTEQPIVVVSTFYNCQDYIARCIASIACQDYDNYSVYLVNDASTDDTLNVINETLSLLPSSVRDKFYVINNEINIGAVANQVTVIRGIQNPDTIVMILDGDDSLVNDNTIFNYYNSIYDGSTEFTYGSCWSMVDNIPLISQPYPDAVKRSRSYRQHRFNWNMPYTHLRTFKQRLITNIPDSNFQDETGQWYRAGGDGSTFYSLIEAADPDRIKCLQEVVYNYNDINPLNDYKVNSIEQNTNASKILGVNIRDHNLFSVITPTMWRCPELFELSLNQLVTHDLVDEIIIINNAVEQTPNWPVLGHEKIKMLNQTSNIKVNPAWNLGVATSRNPLICIANDDILFDIKLFNRIRPKLTPHAGAFGIISGEAKFGHPELTDGSIDFIEWSPGKIIHGFGQLMFVHKDNWLPIIDGLEIYFGDDFIFHSQLIKDRKNYMIANIHYQSPFAATSKDQSIVAGFHDREQPIFAEWFRKNPIVQKQQITPNAKPAVKKILVAIPTARNIEAETFRSIYNLIVPDGYQVDFQYFYGYNVDQVRNLIADWTVNSYDYLFSVDSDIAFTPDTLVRLLAHDRDIVSGLYIQRKPGQHILEVYEHNQNGGVTNIPYERIRGQGLVEIASCGFGCVLVKSEVMRAIGYPQFEYHSAIDHANTISEDVDFCKKAIAKGFTLWADTAIKCRHIGSSEFTV
jgi:glycosyltransferase involved in cell wall biosynthesis